jgi:hypothetical protein
MMNGPTPFAICVNNQACDDLELLKLYEVLPDQFALKEGYIRITDESGEDYLYPQAYFILIQLSSQIETKLLNVIHHNKP